MAADAQSAAANGRIRSRGAFREAARAILLALPVAQPRELLIVDADFEPWPLGDADVVDALTQWVRLPGRRLRLLGARFDVVEREQPRFAAWRKSFAHAVECQSPSDVEPGDVPSLLLLDAVALELLDREHGLGRQSGERRWLVELRERTDALAQRAESAWPVTVLGL